MHTTLGNLTSVRAEGIVNRQAMGVVVLYGIGSKMQSSIPR